MFLKKLRRQAAMVTGDFAKIFGNQEVPACPRVVMKLLKALRDPDISIEKVASLLETDAGLSARILTLVNSALYGLPGRITSVAKACSILGLKEIENLTLCHAMAEVIRDPGCEGFDLDIFWTDSLERALFARQISIALGIDPEDGFAGGLMQDMALPILLTDWFDIYHKVFEKWQAGDKGLESVEMEELSWNHCQAGAWIAKSWGLPDILVCCIGLHSSSAGDLVRLNLTGTAVVPVMLSSRIIWARIDTSTQAEFIETAKSFGLDKQQLITALVRTEEVLNELGNCFDIAIVTRDSLASIIDKP